MTAHHATAVAAPRGLTAGSGPLILDRDDPDFVGAVLHELGSEAGRAKLAATRAQARDAQQRLKLYQPVQRRFHLALIEAWCETAGGPRIDPARVDAAGLVLRRVRERVVGGRTVEMHEGWMSAAGQLRGWVEAGRLGDADADPKPAVRLEAGATGVAQIDRALRALAAHGDAALLDEQVTPLFVAPPEVCNAAGRTIFYGVVPTASSELAQTDADVESAFAGFGPESTAFRGHLVQPLRGQRYLFPVPPDAATHRFDAGWLEALTKSAPGSRGYRFLQLLRQVAVELDAFGESAASRSLRAELAAITLSYRRQPWEARARTVDAASFLHDAVQVLFDEKPGAVEMPVYWPTLTQPARTRLAQAMSVAMRERFRAVMGRPGRFDEPDAQYVLRAFVRLKPAGRCPAKTIWSGYSERFVIAPWYETVGNPVQIALPNLRDRALLKSLKPNVAFVLPRELQNLLSGNPKDLMDGKSGNGGFDIGWICSFSIPVITFCAFIVLNIFLSLFDLIFRWLLFIKICIPYPKAK